MKKLIEQNPVTRTKTEFGSFADREFAVRERQDASEILKINKEQRKASDGRFNLDGMTHVARIPKVVWDDLVRRGIAYDDKAFKKWLDRRDIRGFRTHPGRLS